MKIGIAHVAPAYNQGASVFTDGVDAIAAFGADTIKLWCSGNYNGAEYPTRPDYTGQVWGSVPTTLSQLVQTTPYAYALAHAGINRYFLGTWTFANGIFDPWLASIPQSVLTAEYTEIFNLCVTLLTTTSNKDFIIQTAESDWVVINSGLGTAFDPSNVIDKRVINSAVAFYGARVRAVRDARASVVGATSRVFSCIEVNRVLDGGRRIHRDVLPRLDVDMVSWTSYEGIDDWTLPGATQASVEAAIESKTIAVVEAIRHEMEKVKGPAARKIPIVVGEVGWPENHALFDATFDVGAFLQTMLDTATALDLEGVNFWQLWDNETYSGPTRPQGRFVYDDSGVISEQGVVLAAALA